MSRWSEESRPEREAFWRSHLEGWRRSELNQREYCEARGLPLKRFGNWRPKFKQEELTPRKLLYRRGGGLSHDITAGNSYPLLTRGEAKAMPRERPAPTARCPGSARRVPQWPW